MKGPSHYRAMESSETRVRIYGKTAVLWGLVDVTPAKGETYRTRTLEVYTQNPAGLWQMSQKESMQGSRRSSEVNDAEAPRRRVS